MRNFITDENERKAMKQLDRCSEQSGILFIVVLLLSLVLLFVK